MEDLVPWLMVSGPDRFGRARWRLGRSRCSGRRRCRQAPDIAGTVRGSALRAYPPRGGPLPLAGRQRPGHEPLWSSRELEAQAPRPVSRIRFDCGSRHVEKVVPPGLVDVADHGEGELAGRGRYGLRDSTG
jgi:hypothetical protein